jgi:hypothetical protein
MVEHSYRRKTPAWAWLVFAGSFGTVALVAYLLATWILLVPALGTLPLLVGLRPKPVRLVRDFTGELRIEVGRRRRRSVNVSRLKNVTFTGTSYHLVDTDGNHVVAALDSRLLSEVRPRLTRSGFPLIPTRTSR